MKSIVGSLNQLGPRLRQSGGHLRPIWDDYDHPGTNMQKRLIEEMAKLRGGKTRLKDLREEYHDEFERLTAEAAEAGEMLDLIDEVTGSSEAHETSDEDACQEATDREPVDSLGE